MNGLKRLCKRFGLFSLIHILQAVNIESQPIHTRNGERKLIEIHFNSPKDFGNTVVGLWSVSVQEAVVQWLSKVVQIPLLELKPCTFDHFAN